MRDESRWTLAPLALALASTAAAFLPGCCCCWSIPVDADNPTSVLIIVADAFVPMAIVFALYLRQERKHRPAWAARHLAKSGLPGGAYRAMEMAFESVRIPRTVRAAGCLGFVDVAASLPAVVEAGDRSYRAWVVGGGFVRLAVAAGPLVMVLTLGLASAVFGQRVLARKATAQGTRRAGAILAALSVCLVGLVPIGWKPLLADLSILLHQPFEGPPTFGPTTVTLSVASAVVAWPLLELLTGVALIRAAPELEATRRTRAPRG